MRLSAEQGRVLGALVEKERTTPPLYPLTDAALLAACNQATSREPVVHYDIATLRPAVRELRERGLLRTVHRSGERSDKHRHELLAALALSEAQCAVLALLLLRGPQTAAELRARAERLQDFGSVDDVEAALTALAERDEPLAVLLERQPGRSAQRWDQLLAEPIGSAPDSRRAEQTETPGADALPWGRPAPDNSPQDAAAPAPTTARNRPDAEPAPDLPTVLRRVEQLEAEVQSLRARLDRLDQPHQHDGAADS